MQIIYSIGLPENAEGRTVKNPRHFRTPVEGATKVYIDGDWPTVAESYKEAGVDVESIDKMRALPGRARSKADDKPSQDAPSA